MKKLEDISFLVCGRENDMYCKCLQQFHEIIWNKRFEKFKIDAQLKANTNCSCKLTINGTSNINMRVASDTLFTGFYKDLIPADFHILAHTFGGKIIFPKYLYKIKNENEEIRSQTINQRRGEKSRKIYDRIDYTLKYIKEFYDNKNGTTWPWGINSLFQTNDENPDDENFFDIFDSFDNFIEFFFLQDFVKNNEVIDIMATVDMKNPTPISANSSSYEPQIKESVQDDYNDPTTDLGRWRINSTKLLFERNRKIDKFISDSNLLEKLQQKLGENLVDKICQLNLK